MTRTHIWIYWNDTLSKIDLTEEHTAVSPIRLRKGGRTEEGYHREQEVFWINDGNIYCHYSEEGRDCDGRYSYEQLSSCPVALAHADVVSYEGETIARPAWKTVDSRQRDYTAEAAGY